MTWKSLFLTESLLKLKLIFDATVGALIPLAICAYKMYTILYQDQKISYHTHAQLTLLKGVLFAFVHWFDR